MVDSVRNNAISSLLRLQNVNQPTPKPTLRAADAVIDNGAGRNSTALSTTTTGSVSLSAKPVGGSTRLPRGSLVDILA